MTMIVGIFKEDCSLEDWGKVVCDSRVTTLYDSPFYNSCLVYVIESSVNWVIRKLNEHFGITISDRVSDEINGICVLRFHAESIASPKDLQQEVEKALQ